MADGSVPGASPDQHASPNSRGEVAGEISWSPSQLGPRPARSSFSGATHYRPVGMVHGLQAA